MRRIALIFVSAAAMLAVGSTIAGEIYKWTDADGNVHYVDRPTGDPSEQRVSVVSRSTNNSSVKASIDARRDREAAREEKRASRAEAEKEAAQAKADEEKRQQQCQTYRAQLESYLQSQRLYREDESGERVYLEEAEMLEARAKVQDKIQETCN